MSHLGLQIIFADFAKDTSVSFICPALSLGCIVTIERPELLR
jgi:hypothetical protein